MSIRARAFAEKTLIKAGIMRLPILSEHIQEYLEAEGWEFISYSLDDEKSLKLLNKLNLLDHAKHNPGFSYCNGDTRIIFYRNDLSEKEKVIVFAHELGHIKIGHLSSFGALGYDAGFITKPQEDEANDFAVEFLAPTYILHQAHIKTEEEIQSYTLLNKKYSGRVLSNLQDKISVTGNEKRLSQLFKTYIANHTKHKAKRTARIAAPIVVIVSLTVMLSAFITNHNQEEDIKQVQTTAVPETTEERTQIDAGNVYITTSGKKYHRPTCGFVKNKSNVLEISVEEAIKMGYKPCEVCNP